MLQRSHHATDSMTEIYEVGSKRLSQSGNMRARRRKRQTVREQESKRETERLGDRVGHDGRGPFKGYACCIPM